MGISPLDKKIVREVSRSISTVCISSRWRQVLELDAGFKVSPKFGCVSPS